MNTTIINSLEGAYFLLIALTLFQITKHYILCAISSHKTKRKYAKPQTTCRSDNNSNQDNKTLSPLNYYNYKLPEPEISISSERSAIFHLKDIHFQSLTPSFQTKEAPKQIPKTKTKTTLAPQEKSVLNNYIDDFFSVSPKADSSKSCKSPLIEHTINSPANDEFITVQKTNNDTPPLFANNEFITLAKTSNELA